MTNLADTFYHLIRQYPGRASLYTIEKGVVDVEAGKRTGTDSYVVIDVVVPPVRLYNAYLTTLVGRVVKNKTQLLTPTLPIVPESSYLLYKGMEYRNLSVMIHGAFMIIEGEASS